MSDGKFTYIPSEDALEHWGLGETAKKHLYSARKWVNGKWQYIYNNVNNALGADEKHMRDATDAKYRNYLGKSVDKANAYKNAKSNYDAERSAIDRREAAYNAVHKNSTTSGERTKDNKGATSFKEFIDQFRNGGNNGAGRKEGAARENAHAESVFNGQRTNAYSKLDKARNEAADAKLATNRARKQKEEAQAAYDKTVYGKIEKGKKAISDIFNKVKKGAKNAAGTAKSAIGKVLGSKKK